MELRNTKNNVFFEILLILMIFCLFVTGCRQDIDTNPDNNDEDTKITTPDNNGGDANIDVTNPDNNDGGPNTDVTNPDNNDGGPNTDVTNPDNNGGDTNTNAGAVLENGFKPSSSDADPPPNYCAYKSDINEFDIDDVTLDFFFGGYYPSGVEHELSHSRNYPTFDLYFVDDDGNSFFVRRIEENFVSEKYSCEVVYDENWYITEIKYNYSEQITIPSDVFTKENGQVTFEIRSVHANDIESEMRCITGIKIFYQVSNGKVILSSQ